jgi:hypothetical protein
MTILFICGSLEPGADGVGDYTRRLAGEVIGLGHRASILALNDQFVSQDLEGFQEAEGEVIAIRRLPSICSEKKRYAVAKSYIDSTAPDWVSLQFVPFSFHQKGLPLYMVIHINQLIGKRKVHLMFHELWVGMEENASWKHKIWGTAQKILIHLLLKRLKPNVTPTQSTFYQRRLANMGFSAQLLPLFGNVPRIAGNNPGQIMDKLNCREGKCTGVVFGSIRKNSPIDQFADEASLISKKEGIEFKLIIVGRSGVEKDYWINTWRKAGLEVQVLGEQPTAVISEVFENSSFGISTTPYPLIEKSGAVAAMREHGLPILCISNPWNHPDRLNNLPLHGITLFRKNNLRHFLDEKKALPFSGAADIPQQFINSLTS